jgi:hypothetical protein
MSMEKKLFHRLELIASLGYILLKCIRFCSGMVSLPGQFFLVVLKLIMGQ